MRIKKVMASEWEQYKLALAESTLMLPFYATHSAARAAFFKEVQARLGTTYCLYEGRTIRAFLVFKKQELQNFLVCDILRFSWQQFFTMTEQFFKSFFAEKIALRMSTRLNSSLQEMLLEKGFNLSEPQLITKRLNYQTALVLGGGGARGAYQIGVWQALKEQRVPISVITGTSVGALNGALIAQDDFEAAKTMWKKIETQKIVAFPTNQLMTATLSGLMSQIGAFTVAALQSKGVSTEPLQQLISDTFSEMKLQQSQIQFFLVATELPSLQEKSIPMNQCQDKHWQQWLLASASFFPAMAATKIGNHYYVDGGYRNNVPVDIALNNGASECIIVDVKGPGLTKPVRIPANISCLTLKTPWSMGAVLLFDGARSNHNIQLGYLETMKALGKYAGYWYTFKDDLFRIFQFGQQFIRFMEQQYQIKEFYSFEKVKKICQKLRNIYKDRVYLENIGLVLLELIAKNDAILATKIYTINELVALLKGKWAKEGQGTEEKGLISVEEWLKKYYDDYFLLSQKQQLKVLTDLLNGATTRENKQRDVVFMLDKFPIQLLQVLFKEFIQ